MKRLSDMTPSEHIAHGKARRAQNHYNMGIYEHHPLIAAIMGNKGTPRRGYSLMCRCCSDPSHMTSCTDHGPQRCPPCPKHGDANRYMHDQRAEWIAYQAECGAVITPDWAAHEAEFAEMKRQADEHATATRGMQGWDSLAWAYGDATQRAEIEAKYPKERA